MAASLVVVTDQLPYPPRNGITLPIDNYMVRLIQKRELKLCLLVDRGSMPDQDLIRKNEERFGQIEFIFLKRRSRLRRIIDEFCSNEMFQHGWLPERPMSEEVVKLDVLLVSPMSAVAKWNSVIGSGTHRCRYAIAAVNDCTAAEYYFRKQQGFGSLRLLIKGWLDRMRARAIGRIEAKLLSSFDAILLQTEKDKELLGRLSSLALLDKVSLVPNGVRSELLSIAPDPHSRQVALVAELSGEYAPIAEWLLKDVWPCVRHRHPDWVFHIVGRGASDEMHRLVKRSDGVVLTTFVDDLGEFYRESAIVLCPIFKGYGLINKTVEAMASALPVVGGRAAFNGIDGFCDGESGLVCEDHSSTHLVQQISNLICDPKRRASIGTSARMVINGNFCWDRSVRQIERLLEAG